MLSSVPCIMLSSVPLHLFPRAASSTTSELKIQAGFKIRDLGLESARAVVKLRSHSHQIRFNLNGADSFLPADKSLKLPSAMATVAVAAPPKPVRRSITHVIFDMDGLLLDTENFYTKVQEIILARYNKTFDWSLKPKMMGKKALEAATIFVEETGISDSLSAEDFLVEREAMLRDLFPTCDLMPGASRLIRHLHAKGIPFCLATGSHKWHFELKTQRHRELFSLMHHVVLGDDPEVKQGKPSPDIFLAAARRFEGGPIDPQNALVFEDAPAGVGAAKAAGMSAVMVPDPRLDSSYHSAADQVLKSLLDFDPAEWGLPPFEDIEA